MNVPGSVSVSPLVWADAKSINCRSSAGCKRLVDWMRSWGFNSMRSTMYEELTDYQVRCLTRFFPAISLTRLARDSQTVFNEVQVSWFKDPTFSRCGHWAAGRGASRYSSAATYGIKFPSGTGIDRADLPGLLHHHRPPPKSGTSIYSSSSKNQSISASVSSVWRRWTDHTRTSSPMRFPSRIAVQLSPAGRTIFRRLVELFY